MNKSEYKQLTYKLVEQLKEKLPDNDIHILQDTLNSGHPMMGSGLLIGISQFKGSSSCEVYEVQNDGDVASYSFRGTTELK